MIKRQCYYQRSARLLCTVVLVAVLALTASVSTAHGVTTSDVNSKLNSLVTEYQGTQWNGNYYGIQCKGFANLMFKELFGVTYIGPYHSTDKHYIPNPSGAWEVGRINLNSLTVSNAKALLQKGQPGDFIQVRRKGKTYGHSMILRSRNDSGITVFDCNSDGKNTVKVYSISWSAFAEKNSGMSLYRANNYEITSTPSVSSRELVNLGTNFTATIHNPVSGKLIENVKNEVRLGKEQNHLNERWRFNRCSDGTYIITSLLDDTVLDVHNFGNTNGTRIRSAGRNNSNAQRWMIVKCNGGYQFIPVCSPSKVMDVSSGSTAEGAVIHLWEPNNTKAQIFTVYTLLDRSMVNMGKDFYASVINTKFWNPIVNTGSNVRYEKGSDAVDELWHFTQNADGSYTIMSLKDGKVLSIDQSTAAGTNVKVCEKSGKLTEKWYVIGESAKYMLRPAYGKCVLDMSGGSFYEGVNAQVYTVNDTAAQLHQIWKFKMEAPTLKADTSKEGQAHFTWNGVYGVNSYRIDIWKGTAASGTPYETISSITARSLDLSLPEGTYCAKVQAVNAINTRQSAAVQFTVSAPPMVLIPGIDDMIVSGNPAGETKDDPVKESAADDVVVPTNPLEDTQDNIVDEPEEEITEEPDIFEEPDTGENMEEDEPIVTAPKKMVVPKIKAFKKKIKIWWNQVGEDVSGYRIVYAKNRAFTKGKIMIDIKDGKTTSKVIGKLKSKQKYYIKICAYKEVGSNRMYGEYSKAKSIKVK